MEDILKEFGEDFIAFSIKKGTGVQDYELGVRIGNPVLRHAIDKIPEQKIKDTNYNRQTLKWFRFNEIDVRQRQIVFYSRLRIMKFTNKPWPLSGTWCVYDNAWDVVSGLNLEVKNKSISGNVHVRDAQSDWPGGLGGIFLSIFDAFTGSTSWILTGEFSTISDVVTQIGALALNISNVGDITKYLSIIDNFNHRSLIYLNRTDYDRRGFWQWYKVESAHLDEVLQKVKSYFSEHDWLSE